MSAEQVIAILASSRRHLDALQLAALAGPKGGWIGAGFVRNAVWDTLSGRAPQVRGLADLDLVHFDAEDASAARDAAFEAALRAARPRLPWSVANQARMAARNGHAPYRDLSDALAHWPETATAIAARLVRGRVEALAPHGLDDLLGMIVRPTPAHAGNPRVPRERFEAKRWAHGWPALRGIGMESR